MPKFWIEVDERTLERLAALARRERRDPREQAAYLVERALFEPAAIDAACANAVEKIPTLA